MVMFESSSGGGRSSTCSINRVMPQGAKFGRYMKAYAIMNCSFHIPIPCAEPKRDRTTAIVLSNTNGEVSLAILAPL